MIFVSKTFVNNGKKIGTNFKKENIFVGTISYDENKCIKRIREDNDESFRKTSDEQLKALIEIGIIDTEECDLFYKGENGYICFNDEIETIIGDNSDGKGTIVDLVSAWDYFTEDDLYEIVENDIPIILSNNVDPLLEYNNDYKERKSKGSHSK